MNKKEIIIISIIATVIIVLLILLISNRSQLSFYQTNDYINRGNSYFEDEKYDNAIIQYTSAATIDSMNTAALYNGANTYYKLAEKNGTDPGLSDMMYEQAVKSTKRSDAPQEFKDLADEILHNKGNSVMKKLTPLDSILTNNEMIQQAEAQGRNVNEFKQVFYNSLQENLKKVNAPINDYKESLRKDPADDSTRFNLAMAQDYQKKLLEILLTMNPPSQNNQNQNQNNKDDKKDDQKDQQQQQQQQQQDQQDQQDQQEKQNQMSKENAEQILKALEENEKDNIKKIRVEKKGTLTIEKDW